LTSFFYDTAIQCKSGEFANGQHEFNSKSQYLSLTIAPISLS